MYEVIPAQRQFIYKETSQQNEISGGDRELIGGWVSMMIAVFQ